MIHKIIISKHKCSTLQTLPLTKIKMIKNRQPTYTRVEKNGKAKIRNKNNGTDERNNHEQTDILMISRKMLPRFHFFILAMIFHLCCFQFSNLFCCPEGKRFRFCCFTSSSFR